MQTSIKKWGNSAGARIPAAILHQAGFNIDDTVDIEVIDNKVILSLSVKTQTLEALLALSPTGSFKLLEEDKQWLDASAVGNEVIS